MFSYVVAPSWDRSISKVTSYRSVTRVKFLAFRNFSDEYYILTGRGICLASCAVYVRSSFPKDRYWPTVMQKN
jgi:hypothetical protein